MRQSLIVICALLVGISAFSQNSTAPTVGINTQPWEKNFMDGISVGGYFRMFYYDRNMTNRYGTTAADRTISVVDPVYYDPMLFLYLGGNPTPNSSLGVELRVDNYMTGAGDPSSRVIALFNGLVLRANTKTKNAGDYAIRFGGIEWMNITPFTFGNNVGYQRYSVFERRPWDPGGNVKTRAASYYYRGTINQDVRFGTNAFKGLMLDVTNLPHNMSANILYGYSQTNSGYLREDIVQPKRIYGGRLVKSLDKKGEISIATYNSISYQDSLRRDFDTRKRFHMIETFGRYNFHEKASVSLELGYGRNIEPQTDALDGTAIMFDVTTNKKWTKLPLTFRAYRFEKYFINLDSYVGNTTLTPYLNNFYQENSVAIQPPGGRLTGVGDLVNNRMGLNVNAETKIKRLKIIGGVEFSQDIERFDGSNTISYGHRINGVQWSRFVQFPNAAGNFGPNNRVGSFYRGAYETVNISDTLNDGGLRSKLYYSSADVQFKYNFKIADRDVYLFNLNTFSTVGNSASILPMQSNKNYINAHYHEFEAYYHVWRDITLSAYYGVEFIKGNDKTDLELQDSGELKARNQKGTGVGLGVDYQLNSSTFLYLRHRWFDFNDRNFKDENFSGKLLTVEMKIFF